MDKRVRVGITQGDHNGVGPEVALKATGAEGTAELYTPVLFADWGIAERAARENGIDTSLLKRVVSASEAVEGCVNVVDLDLGDAAVNPGHPDAVSGAAAVKALETATAALASGDIDVLVTAPISKEACQGPGFRYPGHTEYLQSKAGGDAEAQMILCAGDLRVALLTTHLPVARIAGAVTRDGVVKAVRKLDGTLRRDFGKTRPRIAVLSLNPHCGDGGLLGSEETDTILPAVKDLQEEGMTVFGPFAADGFFGSGAHTRYDGILAMYHDQGLAPFKALAGDRGVNYTAGLPFVRTSPDHGTACDIAWQGRADDTSMREAIYMAVDIFRTRRRIDGIGANPLRKYQPKPQPHKKERPAPPEKAPANEG